MAQATVLIVPGLRDHVAEHWQTILSEKVPKVRTVPAMGRDNIDCGARCAAIERAARAIDGDIVVVAHSGGAISVAHWAQTTNRAVRGALLATPPDFETPMPPGYPTMEELDHAGWLPVPWGPLPFPTVVAASRNDHLAQFERVEEMAGEWSAELVDLGPVGHLNPDSGFGEWQMAAQLVADIEAGRLGSRKIKEVSSQ